MVPACFSSKTDYSLQLHTKYIPLSVSWSVTKMVRNSENLEVIKCKRCNRPLTSKKSKKLGYGPTCHQIIQATESSNDALLVRIEALEKQLLAFQNQPSIPMKPAKLPLVPSNIPSANNGNENKCKIPLQGNAGTYISELHTNKLFLAQKALYN